MGYILILSLKLCSGDGGHLSDQGVQHQGDQEQEPESQAHPDYQGEECREYLNPFQFILIQSNTVQSTTIHSIHSSVQCVNISPILFLF